MADMMMLYCVLVVAVLVVAVLVVAVLVVVRKLEFETRTKSLSQSLGLKKLHRDTTFSCWKFRAFHLRSISILRL